MFSIVKKISRQTICVMIMNDSSISKRPRHCYHRRQFLVGGDDYWNSPPDFQTDPTSATGVQYKHRTCKMAMMMMMLITVEIGVRREVLATAGGFPPLVRPAYPTV